MNDEFAQELARMAQVLHEQPDVEQTAERFLEFVLPRIGTGHASLLLVMRGGRLESASATDALVEEADRVQLETGEGPSFSVVQDEKNVVSGDVSGDLRWPRWSVGVAGVGLRSVLSVRLRTPTTTVGVLNLYDATPERFGAYDDVVAQVFADHAAVAVANARSESTLWQAIDARKLIGQAQGILMERFDLTDEQAFAVLRRYSQDRNVKLRDVAQRLIETRKLS
ncbi:GAF and ANTAR domain-containing protein [Kribbella sp. NPDC051770]|uniref:GAF and ANTAR domain-containing protein n=1 Tax=Kribbella sp. NPDC051770 TaxID=3155413 RepID=UPI00343EF2EB